MSDSTPIAELKLDNVTVYTGSSGTGPGSQAVTSMANSAQAEDLEAQKNQSARSLSVVTYSASINPLVAAAAHLLSAVTAISRTQDTTRLIELNSTLLTDIQGYKLRALNLGAESHLINEASYVLCTFVDEAVLQTEAGKTSKWSTQTLLFEQHQQTSGGEQFFKILASHIMNPVKHLHLLELMYLCLALGFRGKYGVEGHEKNELEDTRDGLYRTIRHLRGDVPRELSPHWHGLKDKRRDLIRIVPWWLVMVFTVMCLAVMYSGFAWVLSEQRETVLEPYRQLDAAVIKPPLQDKDA
ncbi:MAG: rane protein [Pseudomonas sp.]|jgi:type VI secretion system protein ImpK|uniref:type IVB secretion system protein IcmH/DotU n=1 Tax=Pseudomonas sp. TaxID=306 RepID=UPI0026200C5A|nr:type IVB secretion system protein IcmH/DotU [Pseudomonas sp.]MDB6050746.1 rane protein [Pseudomonas sp.]